MNKWSRSGYSRFVTCRTRGCAAATTTPNTVPTNAVNRSAASFIGHSYTFNSKSFRSSRCLAPRTWGRQRIHRSTDLGQMVSCTCSTTTVNSRLRVYISTFVGQSGQVQFNAPSLGSIVYMNVMKCLHCGHRSFTLPSGSRLQHVLPSCG